MQSCRGDINRFMKSDNGKYGIFPEEVIGKAGKILKYTDFYCNAGETEYCINNEKLAIPYRLYHNTAGTMLLEFFEQGKIMSHCIGTRNHNGFVRQKHLKFLLEYEFLYWTVPYIIKICDEYVIQILEMVYAELSKRDTEIFKKFTAENPEMIGKCYGRMVSYWNAYYRYKYRNLKEYVGYKLFKEHFGYCIKHRF